MPLTICSAAACCRFHGAKIASRAFARCSKLRSGVSTFCTAEEERESKFWAAQIGFWERGKVCRRAEFTRLVLRFKASRFTAGLPIGVVTRFKPVSNGLFLRLEPRTQMIPDETD
jgi:purine nucleoside permease